MFILTKNTTPTPTMVTLTTKIDTKTHEEFTKLKKELRDIGYKISASQIFKQALEMAIQEMHETLNNENKKKKIRIDKQNSKANLSESPKTE